MIVFSETLRNEQEHRHAAELRAIEAERRAEEAEKTLADFKARPTIHCSFCGKSEHRVALLIAGPTSNFICDECVDVCTGIIQEKRA